jgi:hypothetical protein
LNKQKKDMKKPKNYDDNTKKLQTKWATKLPWAKG